MKIQNNYVKWTLYTITVLALLLFASAVYVENYFSKRIRYKKPEFIAAERKKMIEDYGAQSITVTTQDNKKIAALYVKRSEAQRIFLICHGFKRSKEYLTGFLELFPQDNLFFIDFRGHGQSDCDRVSLGLNEHLDVLAAADYIKKNISSQLPLFALGISMGGSAVLRAAAAGAPFDAVISDSAPSSFKDTIICVLQRTRNIPFPIGWTALTWYEFVMTESFSQSCYRYYASKIACPVLLMHDERDHLIDYKHAENIFSALGSTCKLLYTTSGTRHGKMHTQIPQEYKKVIDNFIQKCVNN